MQTKILVSVDDYLIAEKKAFHKSEYMAGEVIATAGVSLKHDLITNRINALLFECLLKRGCKLFSKDVLVRVKEYEAFFYPDIVIACGNIKLFKRPQGAKALLEPTISWKSCLKVPFLWIELPNCVIIKLSLHCKNIFSLNKTKF